MKTRQDTAYLIKTMLGEQIDKLSIQPMLLITVNAEVEIQKEKNRKAKSKAEMAQNIKADTQEALNETAEEKELEYFPCYRP